MRPGIAGGVVLVLVLVALVIAWSCVFTVYQTQQVIVVRLGEPVRVVTDPGLHFKLSLFDSVIGIDKRILDLENPAQEVIASDQKRLVVDAFARYRIQEPLKFYQTVNTIPGANSQLSILMNAALRRVLGEATLTHVVRDDRAALMARVRDQLDRDMRAGNGRGGRFSPLTPLGCAVPGGILPVLAADATRRHGCATVAGVPLSSRAWKPARKTRHGAGRTVAPESGRRIPRPPRQGHGPWTPTPRARSARGWQGTPPLHPAAHAASAPLRLRTLPRERSPGQPTTRQGRAAQAASPGRGGHLGSSRDKRRRGGISPIRDTSRKCRRTAEPRQAEAGRSSVSGPADLRKEYTRLPCIVSIVG